MLLSMYVWQVILLTFQSGKMSVDMSAHPQLMHFIASYHQPDQDSISASLVDFARCIISILHLEDINYVANQLRVAQHSVS